MVEFDKDKDISKLFNYKINSSYIIDNIIYINPYILDSNYNKVLKILFKTLNKYLLKENDTINTIFEKFNFKKPKIFKADTKLDPDTSKHNPKMIKNIYMKCFTFMI